MKRKIFSKLLMGALLVASVSSFTSCKDYDDDINSLKESVAKAALQSNLEALTQQVNSVKTTAESALSTANAAGTKVDLDAVKKTANDALKDAAQGILDAATAQEAADKANELAQKANDAVAKIDLSAYVTKTEYDAAVGQATEQITKMQSSLADYVLASTLEDRLAELKKEIEAANETQMKEMKTKVDNAIAGVQSIWDAVTNVSLVIGDFGGWGETYATDNKLAFGKIMEKKNKWPAKDVADAQYTFTAGNFFVGTDGVIVRVLPTTTVLTKDNVTLINSLGEEISKDLVTVKNVFPFEGKLTRAGENNGLWYVEFELNKNYDSKAFDAAAGTDKGAETTTGTNVLYAVAVNNTADVDAAKNRRGVSAYDLTLSTFDYRKARLGGAAVYQPGGAGTDVLAGMTYVQGYDGWKLLTEVRNRVRATDGAHVTGYGTGYEYDWADAANSTVPADGTGFLYASTSAVFQDATDWTAAYDKADGRIGKDVLVARVGDKINIAIDYSAAPNAYGSVVNPIKGFYVTLDEAYAETVSSPSELNAWRSYEYENVGYKQNSTTAIPAKLQNGNTGYITIKNMNNVVSDKIAFRIHAVNLDGTIIDPDGKAFVVQVANAIEGSNTITANIEAVSTTASDNYTIVPITTELVYSKTGDTTVGTGNVNFPIAGATWTASDKNNNGPVTDFTTNVPFTVEPCDADGVVLTNATTKNSAVKYIKVTMTKTPSDYEDDAEYAQSIDFKIDGVTVKTTTLVVKKVLPGFPSKFAFKSQVAHTGNAYTAFFLANNGTGTYNDKNAAGTAANGQYDLAKTFNGVEGDNKFVFEFAGTKDNDASKSKKAVNNKLVAQTAYIDNTTTHAMTASYAWGDVSRTKNADGNWNAAAAHTVAYPGGEFTVTYACWHTAASYVPSIDLSIKWGNPKAVAVDLSKIAYTNTFNGELYGKSFGELIAGGFLTKFQPAAAEFYAEGSTIKNEHLSLGKYSDATAFDGVKYIVQTGGNDYFKIVKVIDTPAAAGVAEVSHIEYYMFVKEIDFDTNISGHKETVKLTLKDAYGHDVPVEFPITVTPAGL